MSPRSYNLAPTIGAPMPPHSFGDEARAGREAMRAASKRKRELALVTEHPKPHREQMPAGAARLAALARATGFEVHTAFGWVTLDVGKSNERKVEAVRVEGLDLARRRGFRAIWRQGRADSGRWFDGVTRGGVDVGVVAISKRINGGE